MPRPVLTLLLLSLLTFFLGLGRQAITDSDEAFYAEAAREMVESGDWLTPHFNYEDRWQKPVLYYWLTAAIYRIGGPSEWAARFWSALSGIGIVLLTYTAAHAGRPTAAPTTSRHVDRSSPWLAGAIVATCFGCFAEARLALPDLPLTFFITLGIWAAMRASLPMDSDTADSPATVKPAYVWWVIAGLAAGLGFLTKGPVALVVPGVVLLPVWWRERRVARIGVRGVLLAGLVFALVGLPWYGAMWMEHGGEYLRSFFLSDNLERFTTDRFQADGRPVWFYLPIIAGGLMPWSAFLLLPAAALVSRWRRERMFEQAEWRLLLWALMPLLFYTASVGKQPRYILPVLPPLAILLARALVQQIDREETATPTRRLSLLTICSWTTVGILAVVAVLFGRAQSVFINAYAGMSWIAVGIAAASAVTIALIAFGQRWSLLPRVMPPIAATLLLAVQFGALAGTRPEAVEQMAALVREHSNGDDAIGVYNVFVRNLIFYTGSRQVMLDADTVGEFASSKGLLVVRQQDLAAALPEGHGRVEELGRVRYFNAANVRLRTVLRTNPEEEVETILLIKTPVRAQTPVQP